MRRTRSYSLQAYDLDAKAFRWARSTVNGYAWDLVYEGLVCARFARTEGRPGEVQWSVDAIFCPPAPIRSTTRRDAKTALLLAWFPPPPSDAVRRLADWLESSGISTRAPDLSPLFAQVARELTQRKERRLRHRIDVVRDAWTAQVESAGLLTRERMCAKYDLVPEQFDWLLQHGHITLVEPSGLDEDLALMIHSDRYRKQFRADFAPRFLPSPPSPAALARSAQAVAIDVRNLPARLGVSYRFLKQLVDKGKVPVKYLDAEVKKYQAERFRLSEPPKKIWLSVADYRTLTARFPSLIQAATSPVQKRRWANLSVPDRDFLLQLYALEQHYARTYLARNAQDDPMRKQGRWRWIPRYRYHPDSRTPITARIDSLLQLAFIEREVLLSGHVLHYAEHGRPVLAERQPHLRLTRIGRALARAADDGLLATIT